MTPQDLYNEVTRLLDAGEEVMIKDNQDEYNLFFKYKDLRFVCGEWQPELNTAEEYAYTESIEYDQDEFLNCSKRFDWKIVSSTPP